MKQITFLFSIFSIMVSGCGSEAAAPPELERAAEIIERFASPIRLQNSMFSAAFPECKASEYVRYLFSDLGAAELPMGEGLGDEMDRAQAEATGMPLWPDSVGMSADAPDPAKGMQIVLRADDVKNSVTVTMYTDPLGAPAGTREFTVPKVTPSAMAQAFFRSNVETGARY